MSAAYTGHATSLGNLQNTLQATLASMSTAAVLNSPKLMAEALAKLTDTSNKIGGLGRGGAVVGRAEDIRQQMQAG